MNSYSPTDFNFYAPTRIIFGAGSLARLPELVEDVGGADASIFLVTGRHSLRAQGALEGILADLSCHRVTHYDGALPFPSPELVDQAVEACRSLAPDVVVAVGGGSALDLGKLVAVLTANPGPSVDYGNRHRHLSQRGLPFIAVPTTSGSSSEVTSGAALWQMEEKVSYAVNHPLMFSRVALVDPDLALSMPGELAAATGMDAFSSAFESYWSREAQPMTDALALRVIRLYSQNLEVSCRNADTGARTNCALAATMSGVGYTNSRPNVCHAFSRPLTLFWGAAHGQAVGITLPSFLAWNAEAIPDKLPALWEALGVSGLEEAQDGLTRLMSSCGLHTRLGQLGVTSQDLDQVLDHVPWERTAMLPRPITRDDAGQILEGLL